MSCCPNERPMRVYAKCSDRCHISIDGHEHAGYVPRDLGIGGGDDVSFVLCLNCGKMRGAWPLPLSAIERDEDVEE